MSGSQGVAPAASDLAEVAPFRIGGIAVDPATRALRGPTGKVTLEPRLMALLIALHAAAGEVVTRDRLAAIGWKGRFVADDSLNAAIAALRRALRDTGEGEAIETVPKTGYRLIAHGEVDLSTSPQGGGDLDAPPASAGPHPSASPDRRALLLGAGALGLAAAGFAVWRRPQPLERDPKVEELLRRGSTDLHLSYPDPARQGVNSFLQAVQLAPNDAKAWGLLALGWQSAGEFESPDRIAAAYRNSEAAARRALALDPGQGDALAALALLQPMFGDWTAAEVRYRKALDADPENPFAQGALATFQMSTGQALRSEALNSEIVERYPQSANRVFKLVMAHWNTGHIKAMDLLAIRGMQRWPDHPAIWFCRFWTLAFGNREAAALEMLADARARPPMPAPFRNALEKALRALGPEPSLRPAALAASRQLAVIGPQSATAVIMLMSALGDPEGALEVARGLLLQEGKLVIPQRHSEAEVSVNDLYLPTAMVLWTPPCAPMRALSGFAGLCDDIGLTDYWHASGNKPDFPISRAVI